jgi:hypothetical protein
VSGLRRAGQENYLPRGLLARAGFRRIQSDFEGAASDLREAQETAEGGSMRLFLCDAHLEWARLHFQWNDAEAARPHVSKARELIDATGYGRREREIAGLEQQLSAIPCVTPASAPSGESGRPVPQSHGGEAAEPARPAIFISYSHVDEKWKERLVKHLRVLELEGELEVWDDRRIDAGDDWLSEITREMERAKVAVLLISADFLISTFIRSEEAPHLLARRRSGGLRVIPVIVHPCPWKKVGWLASIQLWPSDGRALSTGPEAQVDTDLADLALEISRILEKG